MGGGYRAWKGFRLCVRFLMRSVSCVFSLIVRRYDRSRVFVESTYDTYLGRVFSPTAQLFVFRFLFSHLALFSLSAGSTASVRPEQSERHSPFPGVLEDCRGLRNAPVAGDPPPPCPPFLHASLCRKKPELAPPAYAYIYDISY